MIRYLSLFSGIGAFEKALNNMKVDYELIGYSEIDKYAYKAYSLIHNIPETMNLDDVTKIDESSIPLPVDLITYVCTHERGLCGPYLCVKAFKN